MNEPLLTPIDDGLVELAPVAASAEEDDSAVAPINLRKSSMAFAFSRIATKMSGTASVLSTQTTHCPS